MFVFRVTSREVLYVLSSMTYVYLPAIRLGEIHLPDFCINVDFFRLFMFKDLFFTVANTVYA